MSKKVLVIATGHFMVSDDMDLEDWSAGEILTEVDNADTWEIQSVDVVDNG